MSESSAGMIHRSPPLPTPLSPRAARAAFSSPDATPEAKLAVSCPPPLMMQMARRRGMRRKPRE